MVALVTLLLWFFVICYLISRNLGAPVASPDLSTLLPLLMSIAAIIVSVFSIWLSHKRKRDEERKRGFDVVSRDRSRLGDHP